MLAALEQRQSAVLAYEQACKYRPNSFEAHYDLMVLLLASSKPETAIPSFLVAYRTRPQEFDLRMRKAAGAIHRDNIGILTALATIDADRGDLHTGRVWILRALEISPTDPAINFTYGVILSGLNEKEKAIAPLKLAADGMPTSYQAQMEYADLLLSVNHELEAGPYLSRALILLDGEPTEPGLKKLTRETIEKALAKIEQMKQVGPLPPDGDQ